jgi:hypothetical protein
MAHILPGPLVSEITGSFGPISFRNSPHGPLATGKRPAGRGRGQVATPTQILMSHANACWRALSPTDLLAWAAAGAMVHLSAREAYIAAWINQSGDPAAAAPALPVYSNLNPLSGVYSTVGVDLYLTALSRPLNPLEYCLFRVHTAAPSSRRALPRSIHQVMRVSTNGLDLPSTAALANATPFSAWTTNTGPGTSDTWTFEGWFRTPTTPTALATLFMDDSSNNALQIAYPSRHILLLTADAGTTDTGLVWPTDGLWHYLFLTATSGVGYDLWMDATHAPSLPVAIPTEWSSFFYIANDYGNGSPFIGDVQFVRLSTIVRSPTERAAAYNAGHGTPLAVDADTFALWPLASNAGGSSPDLGPNNLPLSVPNSTITQRLWLPAVYLAADTNILSPRSIKIVSRPMLAAWLITSHATEIVPW